MAILIGAILYTFSGAQCINIVFYHFQDVMALFPFMMVGLEKLVEEKKHGYFALACAVNMLCNPIFFFASAIFVILYFIISYCIPLRNITVCVKQSLSCLVEGLVGSMMGSVTAIPVFLSMLGNTRATDLLPLSEWFTLSLDEYIIRFMAFFLPAESMNAYSTICTNNWMSWGAYLPVFGMIFVMAYIWEERDSFSRTSILCMVFAFVPILNNSFVAFSEGQYARWLFMADLILAYVTAKVCENIGQYRNTLIKCSGITIVLLLIYTILTSTSVIQPEAYSLHVCISLLSAVIILLLLSHSKLKNLSAH